VATFSTVVATFTTLVKILPRPTGSRWSPKPSWPALARRGSREAFLYAFDLLELDGHDLRRESWTVRREILASLLRKTGDGISAIRAPRRQRRRDRLPACLRNEVGRRRRQAPRSTLSLGPVAWLGQGQEPGRAGSKAYHGM